MHYALGLCTILIVVLLALKGGNGRRKLSAIALEAEGYTGSVLKRASGGGKQLLYIVPLQDELDLTPLPADAPEFARMPTATCKQCKTVMPLQMLALHIDHCNNTSNSETEVKLCLLCMCDQSCKSPASSEVQCPLCTRTFPVSDIELHASFCGESEEDVLYWVKEQIDCSKTFNICVARDGMVERGLKLWKRRKNGGPVNPLKVSFLGEPGVDTGALKKEFLSTMVAGIEKRLFEGESEKGKVPKYSLNDLDNELFKVAGEIFGVSIAQGGPAPRFMQEWCYHYLITGNLKTDGVHDTELSPLIKTIEDASDLSLYIEEILDCGYTGQINIDHKESILRAIVLHVTTKRRPMLQQMREGLEVYNLIKVMQTKPNECRNLFVVGDDDKVCCNSALGIFLIFCHLMFVTSEEDIDSNIPFSFKDTQPENEVEGETPSVPMVMQWMTGQAHRHLLVSERQKFKIAIVFDHNCLEHMPGHTVCYPIVSACTNTVTLPTAHLGDYESLKTNLRTAIKYGASFDRL
uniref:HECT domain-containing protein n=1 Tax=Gadus morhua TaxID=8049 RepID=A0A8C5F8G8_GADMO